MNNLMNEMKRLNVDPDHRPTLNQC